MPLTCRERVNSQESSSGGSWTLRYIVSGDVTTAADMTGGKIRDLIAATAPATFDGLPRDTYIAVETVHADEAGLTGIWHGEVTYSVPGRAGYKQSELNSVRIRCSTKGGTRHVVNALGLARKYPATATWSYGNLIGPRDDGEPSGTDIIARAFNFTVTKVFANNALPSLDNIYDLTGKVNSGSFTVTDSARPEMSITCGAGDCLFNGAEIGESRSDAATEITFDFSASPSVSDASIGGLSGMTVGGWQVMSPHYAKDTAGGMVVTPDIVAILNVYRSGNFGLLSI